jgi:single-strand DNA-binding protein
MSSMASLSKSIYIGRLTRDPEFKRVTIKGEEVSVANFTIAVDKEVGEGADFYNIVVWRTLADTVGRYLNKGRLIYVEGRTSTRSYNVTKEGVEFQNYVSETHATKVEFLDKAPQQGTQDAPVTIVAEGVTTEKLPW